MSATKNTSAPETPRENLASPRVQTLKGLCQRALSQASSRDELLILLSEILSKTIRPDSLVRISATASAVKLDGLLHPVDGMQSDFLAAFEKHGLLACKTGETQQTRLGRPPSIFFVAVPINQQHGCFDALAAIFTSPSTTGDVLTAVMELVTSHISTWDARSILRKNEELAETAAALLDLTGRLQAETALKSAAQKLVDELGLYLDGPQIAIATCERKGSFNAHYVASTRDESGKDTQFIEFIESVAAETLIRGMTSVWPAVDAAEAHALLTHKQLANYTQAQRVVCVPLKENDRETFGVLIAWGDETLTTPTDAINFLEAAAEPVARSLATAKRSEAMWLQRAVSNLTTSWNTSSGRVWWAVSILACCVMCIPLSYWVECECEVQPVIRRYIAAPFDGKLDRALVEPGDVVTKDQLLARLDGREINWELSGVQAEIHRVRKERDGHIAQGKYGDAEISKFESERLRLKNELLADRTVNLEIRSPIDGIIIAGDLKKTEGAPLSVGQTLYEIAPLDEMTMQVRIPEDEIAYVNSGMPLEIRLDSYPDRTWEAQVDRIQPRAELVGDTNAFLSEVPMENPHELLRPGMQGRAWVKTKARPLAWNLFHKSWERILIWLGL